MSGGKQINCAYCDKEKLSKNEIGLNKKLIHRQIERMMCLTCLAAYFEMTEEKLKEMIDRLKQQGCSLFG
jgi:transcription elongation factor Elf1